jgi:uncharacterized membrane protein
MVDKAHSRCAKADMFFVFAVMVVGLLLRLTMLGSQSLWLDEAFSWHFASGDLSRALSAEKTNPPLYYVILHFWIHLFGSDESSLRLLSVIFGTAFIPVVYVLGNSLFGKRTARLAMVICAVSPFHIYFSQEVRCFALLALLVSGASIFLLRISRGGRRRDLAGYALLGLLSFYTHFYGMLSLVGFQVYWVYMLWLRRVRIKTWLLVHSFIGVLSLPWLIQAFTTAGEGGQKRQYFLLKLPQAALSFLFGETVVPLDRTAVNNLADTLLSSAPALVVSLVLFCLIAMTFYRIFRTQSDQFVFLIATLSPWFLSIVISFEVMIFDRRYLIGTFSIFVVLLAKTILSLSERSSRVLGCVYLLTLCLGVGRYFFDSRYGREQWRDVSAALRANWTKNSCLLLQPDYLDVPLSYYFGPLPECTIKLFGDKLADPSVLTHPGPLALVRSHSFLEDVETYLRTERHTVLDIFFPNDSGIRLLIAEPKEL